MTQRLVAGLATALLLAGCSPTVRLAGSKNEPIHIVMDINIRLDRELDEFFAFEKEGGGEKAPVTKGTNAVQAAKTTEVKK
jgi:hypothetical protein